MAVYALTFEQRFAELVRNGSKRQTIRSLDREPPAVGDQLQFFQAILTADSPMHLDPAPVCTSVQRIRIFKARSTWTAVELDGEYLILIHIRDLALAEGFASTMDFLRYFERRRGLPFEGVLIKWELRKENPHTPPPVRDCCTCKHEGNSIEDWPCRTSMNAAGLSCWQPKEAHNGTART